MLYFYYGTDSQKATDKTNKLLEAMVVKKPDASVFVIDSENLTEDLLQEMTQSSALFQNKYIVHVKRILEDAGHESLILKFLKEIKESENIFIWNEGEVKKGTLAKIEKSAEKVVDVGGTKKVVERTKIFDICNPIINRDKKNLWVKYQELLETCSPEELHGTIFWQFKNIAIASKANQRDSGLAPFPFQNAKKALVNYTDDEIMEKTSELVRIVHEARSGGSDLVIRMEQFVLNI